MVKDLTTGSPGKLLFFFAMPMVIGNIFQQLYNITDSIVVGNFVGANALAAVGASASITFLFIAVATGASIGSSVVISQLFGAKKMDKVKSAISTALIFMLVISVFLLVIGVLFSSYILRWMGVPEKIFADSKTYLDIYFYGTVFLFLYNMCTAIFNSLGDSRTPLYILFISALLNVLLDLLFVIRFQMGVAGVAWATLIAQGVSCIISLLLMVRRFRSISTETHYAKFDWGIFARMMKVAIPSAIQQSIVSIGMICVQTLVNSYGETVMAGYTAATKIDSITIVPLTNIGNAVSSFTAQNIGANKPERIKKCYFAAICMILIFCIAIATVMFLFGSNLVGLFVDSNSEQAVIQVGVRYLRVVSMLYALMGIMSSCNSILRGSGDVNFFMLCTLCNFTVRVAFAYGFTPILHEASIWWSIPTGWFISSILANFRFFSGKWRTKSLIKQTE